MTTVLVEQDLIESLNKQAEKHRTRSRRLLALARHASSAVDRSRCIENARTERKIGNLYKRIASQIATLVE